MWRFCKKPLILVPLEIMKHYRYRLMCKNQLIIIHQMKKQKCQIELGRIPELIKTGEHRAYLEKSPMRKAA